MYLSLCIDVCVSSSAVGTYRHQALLLNLALVCIKIDENFEAVQSATKALIHSPENIKGLLRRAVGNTKLGNFSTAEADFKTLLKVDPRNPEARKEYINMREKKVISAQKEKTAFSSLFEKASGIYVDKEQESNKRILAMAKRDEELKAEYEAETTGSGETKCICIYLCV